MRGNLLMTIVKTLTASCVGLPLLAAGSAKRRDADRTRRRGALLGEVGSRLSVRKWEGK
jgi:hypothetical protein